MLQTQVNYWTLVENRRHNTETENLQREANALTREKINVDWFTAKENQRHNVQSEGVAWTNANENIRHNKVGESISWSTLAETKRHNVQQEGIGWKNAAANMTSAEAARTNAMANLGNYSLNVVKLPSELMKNQAQTKSYNSSANYNDKKAGAVKHEVIQGYGNMIGNLMGGAGRLISGIKSGSKKGVRK